MHLLYCMGVYETNFSIVFVQLLLLCYVPMFK